MQIRCNKKEFNARLIFFYKILKTCCILIHNYYLATLNLLPTKV